MPHDGVFLFLCRHLWYRDIFVESICAIYHVLVCIGWDGADGGKTRRLRGPRRLLGGHTSNYVTCVRVWCMVVSMGRGVSDGKVVDGETISSIVISDMVASRRGDIRDGRMTFAIMVAGAITSGIVGSRIGDISDDGEVTCGVVVSSREGKGDARLVDSGVVSGVVT